MLILQKCSLLKIKYIEPQKDFFFSMLLFTFLVEKCSKTKGNSNT